MVKMTILTRLGLSAIAIIIGVIGFQFSTNPQKARESFLRDLSKRENFVSGIQKDLLQQRWYLIQLRIIGIILILVAIMLIWLSISAKTK